MMPRPHLPIQWMWGGTQPLQIFKSFPSDTGTQREQRTAKLIILKVSGRSSLHTEKVGRCDGTERTTDKDSDSFQVTQLSWVDN